MGNAIGLVATPLTGTLVSLQEAGVRGQAGMAFLQVITHQLETTITDLREEVAMLRTQLRDSESRFYDEREKVSVLKEQVRSARSVKWLQAGMLSLGGVVAGIAGPHLEDTHPGFALGGLLLGIVLVIAGCVPFGAAARPDR